MTANEAAALAAKGLNDQPHVTVYPGSEFAHVAFGPGNARRAVTFFPGATDDEVKAALREVFDARGR